MVLDPKKANQLNCSTCTPNEQALRNCSGKGSPAKIFINHNFYSRCPMAIYLENMTARYLVGIYFECRNTGAYPAPGSWGNQTAFTAELFTYLDNIRAESDNKNSQETSKAK